METKRNRKPEHFYCSSGSPIKDLYILDNDKLVHCGIENSQEIIDSFKDSTDIKLLISRIAEGEYDLLVKRQGYFIDTTLFPKSVVDAQNSIRMSKAMYDSLPEDIKTEIGSFSKFSKWSDSDFDSFIEKHKFTVGSSGLILPSVDVPSVESEVTE